MKFLKWLALSLGALFVLVIVLAVAAPYLFTDKIRAIVDQEIGRYVDADVSYGAVDLSIIRDFPNIAIGLDSLVVTGRGAFDSLELLRLDRFDLGVGFWSVVGEGPIEIRNVDLVRPRIHVLVLPDSTTNTDILIEQSTPAAAAEPAASTSIALERYSLSEASLVYDDRLTDVLVELEGLDHEGSGDFTATRFDLATETDVLSLSMVVAGITYLKQASLDYDAVLAVDTEAGTVTLDDNTLLLNELALNFSGTVGLPTAEGDIATNVTFVAPPQDFRTLWSVIPAAFAKTLDGVKTSGNFKLDGNVTGTYVAATGGLPGFEVNFGVNNGMVQYPALPKSLSAVNIDGAVTSSGGQLSDLFVDVRRFAFQLGDDPFSGKLTVRNGTTDPAFDLEARGRLDLAQVQQAFPIEGVDRLSGLVALDVAAKGTASGAQSGDVTRIQSSGTAVVENVIYEAAGTPRIEVASGSARFDGSRVDLTALQIQAGRSDLAVEGTLLNPFAVLGETGALGGQFTVRSGTLDANEWLVEAPHEPGMADLPAARPFDRFDFGFDATVGRLLYDVYELTDARASGRVTADELQLAASSFNTANSDIALSGAFRNLFGYTYDQEELTGQVNLRSNRLDLLALGNIGVDPTAVVAATSATPAEYIALPERMSVSVEAKVGELLYDDITLRDVTGTIALANQKAAISNGIGKILGGTVGIDGGYTYLGPDREPTFDLKYSLNSIGFREAFEKFNTIEQLAPVANYLSGKFSTEMVLSSTLGRDMMPNLRNLDANGLVTTINAALEGFGPLKKAGEMLGIPQLQNLVIGNTKNWFTVVDGLVTVQPFDVKFQGINATIGGTHGLTQDMNYDIVARIPRAMLTNNNVGAVANQGLAALQGQAGKLGLDLNVGEFVNVKINLTGSITAPKVDLKLLGTDGKGTVKDAATAALNDIAQQARDSVERIAQAKYDEARYKAETKARAVADSVKTEAAARAQALADEAKAKANAEAKKLADEAKARGGEEAKRLAEEALNAQSQEAKDKAREALKGLLKKKPNE